MRSRTYFIIAGAAVLGFAGWYHDFAQRQDAREEAQRAAAAAEQQQLRETSDAARIAHQRGLIAQLEERKVAAAQKAAEAAAAQARRDADRAALDAARDEMAALRVTRQRLQHALEHETALLASSHADDAALAAERAFLENYNAQARESVARVGAVVAAVEQQRLQAAAQAVEDAAAGSRRGRAERTP